MWRAIEEQFGGESVVLEVEMLQESYQLKNEAMNLEKIPSAKAEKGEKHGGHRRMERGSQWPME